jgi:tetratricopeptide (TPR) repeat protein
MNGDKDAARPTYEQALALHLNGRAGEAEQVYRAVLKLQPDHGEALHGLGVLYLQSRRAENAVSCLRQAVVASGGAPTIRNNLGVALCATRRFDEAAEVYRELVRSEPDSVPALLNLGKVLNALGAYEEAVAVLQRATALAPGDAKVLDQLSAALHGLGEAKGAMSRHDEAATQFERAIALAPNFALAHFNRGTALTYLGRKTEAAEAFARAAQLEPANPAFRRALLGVERVSSGNEHLKVLEALMAGATKLDPAEQVATHFALAKAYDETGDYSLAFDALQRANAAKRSSSRYDIERDLARFRAIAAEFTAGFLATHTDAGVPSHLPVFIIGMPRSGTTLIEQILASHPTVFGAGEQSILPDLINAGRAGRDFPADVSTLGGDEWREFGELYVERLGAIAPQAARITDKLPLNFQLVGLIRMALPHARIVHVTRDPMDTCFSCYSILFDDDLDFTCDLTDLGRYYRGYRDLMDHWRSVLPRGAMLEIRYESLVVNLESEARRLIEYCGLNWDARCLAFHETTRPVETASALQVRQPMYSTSVGRAVHYAPWLEPLRRALGDALERSNAG